MNWGNSLKKISVAVKIHFLYVLHVLTAVMLDLEIILYCLFLLNSQLFLSENFFLIHVLTLPENVVFV
jgi:hypothetical protein